MSKLERKIKLLRISNTVDDDLVSKRAAGFGKRMTADEQTPRAGR
jgi:hypothetical protein